MSDQEIEQIIKKLDDFIDKHLALHVENRRRRIANALDALNGKGVPFDADANCKNCQREYDCVGCEHAECVEDDIESMQINGGFWLLFVIVGMLLIAWCRLS